MGILREVFISLYIYRAFTEHLYQLLIKNSSLNKKNCDYFSTFQQFNNTNDRLKDVNRMFF